MNMQGMTVEIRDYERANQPLFALDISLPAAVAAYCKARWPASTVKLAAREWADDKRRNINGITLDEARNVTSGRCSMRSFNTILRHPNGGLQFAIDVAQAVTGQTIEQHLIRERKAHVEQARRLGSLVRNSWAGGPDTRDAADKLASSPSSGRRALRQ